MRKLLSLFVLMLLVGVLLLTGCNSQANVDAEEQEDVAVGYTLYLDNDGGSTRDMLREFDVRLVGDDGFFPTTFKANVGDTVRLFFAFQEPHFITIGDFGIGTNVESEIIEFVPKQSGVFEMICVDCEPVAMSWIVVN